MNVHFWYVLKDNKKSIRIEWVYKVLVYAKCDIIITQFSFAKMLIYAMKLTYIFGMY